MTAVGSTDEPATDEQLVVMLRAIGGRDAAADQLGNLELSRLLGWTATETAASLRRSITPKGQAPTQ